MPAPHHSVFTGRMPFLPPNQQRQSTEGMSAQTQYIKNGKEQNCVDWAERLKEHLQLSYKIR